MMFRKVNDHAVKCIIGEDEIIAMGYALDDILKNQEQASAFMKQIIGKAHEEGFEISEDIHAVQATYLPNHELVLFFSDDEKDQLMDQTIKNLLRAFGLVESVGKERLEEIFDMSGEDKKTAFEKCMSEVVPTEEIPAEQVKQSEADTRKTTVNNTNAKRFVLEFMNLDVTESFCKASADVPGKLYKERGKYYLLADLTSMEEKEAKGFLLNASEYAESLTKDYLKSDYLEEHADLVISKNPITILKNL